MFFYEISYLLICLSSLIQSLDLVNLPPKFGASSLTSLKDMKNKDEEEEIFIIAAGQLNSSGIPDHVYTVEKDKPPLPQV